MLLVLVVCVAKYIGRTSEGKYQGLFIREVQPAFVMGNSIQATPEAAAGYTDRVIAFLAEHQVPQTVLADTKELLSRSLLAIVEKEQNPHKTIDSMALIYEGSIRIRLRDDSGAPTAITDEPDGRISRLSVMGYNNTYIRLAAA